MNSICLVEAPSDAVEATNTLRSELSESGGGIRWNGQRRKGSALERGVACDAPRGVWTAQVRARSGKATGTAL